MWVDSCTPYFRSLLVWQRKLSTVAISSSQFQSLSGRVCFPSKKSGTFKLCTDTVRFCQGYLFLRVTNNRTIKAEYLNAAWAEFIASTWHVCVNPKFQQCSGQMRSTCSDWNQKHKTEGNFSVTRMEIAIHYFSSEVHVPTTSKHHAVCALHQCLMTVVNTY